MENKTVSQINQWNDFVNEKKPIQFLQSWQWGEFQQKLGRQIFRLKGDWGEALVAKYNLPFQKNYLYSPRGPILTRNNADFTQIDAENFLKEVAELARQEKSIFFRFELPVIGNWKLEIGNCRKVADVQPSQTTILDLSKSKEELLAKMHYKTRYNIRLAKRHGVKVREGRPEEIEIFLKLLYQTVRRNKFRPHPDNYYRQLLTIDPDFVKLYLAEYQERVLAANIYIFFGDTAFYVHGASSNEFKNVMAPYLLHWEIIKKAKESGYHYYDFWGIDAKKWPGLTRFKINFGGEIINYPGTFEIVFNQFWYQLYTISKKFF